LRCGAHDGEPRLKSVKLNLIAWRWRGKLTGMTPDRVAASIASFDFLYLAELTKRHRAKRA
jgi:hypothetical protein